MDDGEVGASGRAQFDDIVQALYLRVLGRPVDGGSREFYIARMADGLSAEDLEELLRASEEGQQYGSRPVVLADLRERSPGRYATVAADDGVRVPVFVASSDADYTWLETQILHNGYYELEHGWSLGLDADKSALSELVSLFTPAATLELGCSSGAVMAGLLRAGVDAWGIDLSEKARTAAVPEVRERIVLGDIGTTELGRSFDLACGFDVFEHVAPARVPSLIAGMRRCLGGSGYIVANIPAYGADHSFGEPFPMYLPEWRADGRAERPFRHLLVDSEGYPLHGHLTWATSPWWIRQFEAQGLRRELAVEAAVQRTFEGYFDACPARRAMYVFSLGDPGGVAEIAQRIDAHPFAWIEPEPAPEPEPPQGLRSAVGRLLTRTGLRRGTR